MNIGPVYRGCYEEWNGGHRKEAAGTDRRGRYAPTIKAHEGIPGRTTPRNGRLFQIRFFCILRD